MTPIFGSFRLDSAARAQEVREWFLDLCVASGTGLRKPFPRTDKKEVSDDCYGPGRGMFRIYALSLWMENEWKPC